MGLLIIILTRNILRLLDVLMSVFFISCFQLFVVIVMKIERAMLCYYLMV